jgi:hypothetical protein
MDDRSSSSLLEGDVDEEEEEEEEVTVDDDDDEPMLTTSSIFSPNETPASGKIENGTKMTLAAAVLGTRTEITPKARVCGPSRERTRGPE